jgi:CXXC-20-CXXC protein
MPKCPNCQRNVSIFQIIKHSKWSPIVCGQCNAKLHFDKKNWYTIAAPLLIVAIIKLISTDLLNIKNVFIYFAFLILMIAALINFLIRLNNVKMKIKDK